MKEKEIKMAHSVMCCFSRSVIFSLSFCPTAIAKLKKSQRGTTQDCRAAGYAGMHVYHQYSKSCEN
jgi:hypothetical protein